MFKIKKTLGLLLCCLPFSLLYGQYKITPTKGYTPQIGLMVDMLEDIKNRIEEQVKELDQEQTDFLFDENANSIGSIIMHLVATESYYQVETLEGRGWTAEEMKLWGIASGLGTESRAKFKGKPIKYYLDLWDEVRNKSLEGLKKKDDEWLASDIDESMNMHFAWYHILEHAASHMGQIALVKNRMNK